MIDPRLVRTVAAATTVGLLTGLFDGRGGFIVVPALALALGWKPPPRSAPRSW